MTVTAKKTRKNITGVVLLNKPQGITSNDALQKVRRLYSAAKAGHTGSLDPLATGVLPICFGQATKFSQLLLDADKTYVAKAKLGLISDTGDTDGNILQDNDIPETITKDDITDVLDTFKGNIEQVPSMFSALKHKGTPLYKLARQGITVDRAPRPVTIFSIKLLSFEGSTITIEVCCSKGTYIRTLVEDIGKALGCGACVTYLHRIKTGNFKIEDCYSLEQIQKLVDDDLHESIIQEPECLTSDLEKVYLSDEHAATLLKGQKLFIDSLIGSDFDDIAFWHQSLGFLGVGLVKDKTTGYVVSKRLMSTNNK